MFVRKTHLRPWHRQALIWSNQDKGNQSVGLSLTNRLALERTRTAYERTLTAWVRTGTSLITFGFAVYKFFELKIASINPREGLVTTAMIGPREFGLVLIGIGLLSVLIGTFEHGRDLMALHKHYPGSDSKAKVA